MAAHVSLANGAPVLVGDIPETVAALIARVKSVLKLEDDDNILLQYQNESGARVDLNNDGDLKAAGVGLNVLFAEVVDDDVVVVGESDLQDMPGRPFSLIASLSDDYVHIEVEPPEEPIPESDFKRQQHLKLLRQQVADDLERKLLDVDERLSALKSALPSPQQAQEEQKLRLESEAIIDQLQESFEGRQILEKPSILKRRLQPDLSALDQHQRALVDQQRLLDALKAQALSKELENSHLELKKQTLRQEIDEGQAAAAAWHQHQMLLQQQYQQQQLQLQQQQLQLQQLQQQQQQLPPPQLPPPPQQPQQQQPQQQIDWKSIPVADDSLPKPWEAREDRQGRRFFWNPKTNSTQWQRPSLPPGGRHASGRGWERPAAASEPQSAPVPPRTYSQAASALPAQSSQYWFSIYHLEEMAFQKMQEGVQVPMSYQDLWEALQANKFVVEDTIEHLMAQMASQGL